MIVFNVDLDNTLIYSYKHDIGTNILDVELYNGRNISFITNKTHSMLKQLKEQVLIVPTTTRTIEQYKRVDLKIGKIKYALVCNGGILLENDKENTEWYKESIEMISDSKDDILRSITLLEDDVRRIFEVRYIKNLFVFTKCNNPENVVSDLKNHLNNKLVDIFNNGTKVYVVPKLLTKGNAIQRFKNYMNATKVISAGDSEFDITMFMQSDVSFAPKELAMKYKLDANTHVLPCKNIFSEEVLSEVLEMKLT